MYRKVAASGLTVDVSLAEQLCTPTNETTIETRS
jgi:hypothetical protein